MPLTVIEVKTAKILDKPYKLADEKGPYLLIRPNGSRLWRFKYRLAGIEKLLSLGTYPDTSLQKARAKRDEAKATLQDGGDPSAKRKAEKSSRVDTFSAISKEWLETKRATLTESTWHRDHDQLFKIVGPHLGNKPIAAIEAPDLLAVLRKLEKRGVNDTAHRVRAVCGRVFRYAIATGRAKHDISTDLKGALAPKGTISYAAITDPRGVGELLRSIDGYRGNAGKEGSGQPCKPNAIGYCRELSPLPAP
jgi:hypothetical protein